MGQSRDKTTHDHLFAPLCAIRDTNGDPVGAHGDSVGTCGSHCGHQGAKRPVGMGPWTPFFRSISHYRANSQKL